MNESPLMIDEQQRQWVEQTFARLSLSAKIGQLMHPMLTHYDAAVAQEKLVRQMIDCQVGGAFLFCRPYRFLREQVRAVLPYMEVPPVFSGDYEAGANTIDEGTRFGSAMALAAIADLTEAARLAYQAGRAAAIQGGAAGARWSFAPLADINFNHENPITNVRSYGDDIERIIALSAAYIKGMQEHGMAACIKHFPGDGMDGRDQHLATPVNPLTLSEWEETYGKTFRGAIDAGVWSVMTGHISLPSVSGRHPRTGLPLPATLDAAIQVGLLREKLGFQGLIISDAIRMGGAFHHCYSEGELALLNIASGSDMVLFVEDVKGDIEAVKRGLDEGKISMERIDDAARRVLTFKAKLGLHRGAELPADDEAARLFSGADFAADSDRAGELSVTLLRDLDKIYPLTLKPGAKIVLYHLPLENTDIPALLVGDQSEKIAAQSMLHQELARRGFKVATVFEPTSYEREIANADALIYVSLVAPQAGRGSIRQPQRATQFLDRQRIQSDFPVLFLSLGNPYLLWEWSWMRNFACCYSRTENVQRAYVRALLGEIPFQGKAPVKLPE